MKAYVTAVNEPTIELCIWSLKRNGFEVELIQNDRLLSYKLAEIYDHTNGDFLRVDADIIPNRNLTPDLCQSLIMHRPQIWWWQFVTYDWYKQDTNHSMAFIRSEALPYLRDSIGQFFGSLRPETEISRIKDFYEPRRMESYEDKIMGLHGYGQPRMDKVMELKAKRKQTELYDFDLAMRLNNL